MTEKQIRPLTKEEAKKFALDEINYKVSLVKSERGVSNVDIIEILCNRIMHYAPRIWIDLDLSISRTEERVSAIEDHLIEINKLLQ